MPGPVSDTAPSLPERMRALADRGHERANELREQADRLDEIAAEGPQHFNPAKLVGAWARARRIWCECTGEPLI